MNRPLRLILICLVLLDLGFVHITEGASAIWLVPLVILTLASPFLIRLREHLLYRMIWNGAVVAVFALLVHHATSGGVPYLLEDGLLLAALCQVHLLNNLGPDQRPDLLFFNSFLVPVVTCFLSIDIAYLILFTIYAPLLLLGLSLHVLARDGRPWSGSFMWTVGRGAAGRALVVMGITLLVFFLFPRDFQRRGLAGRSIRFEPGLFRQRGFTEDIDLERSGIMGSGGTRVVMTIRSGENNPREIPEYWRGATLGRFDGREWHPVHPPADPWPWRFVGFGWERPGVAEGTPFDVELRNASRGRLFLPLSARRVQLTNGQNQRGLRPLGDSTMLSMGKVRRLVTYRVTTADPPARPPRVQKQKHGVYSLIQTGTVPTALLTLTRRLRKELEPNAPRHRVVEHLRSWLADNRSYLLPGAEGAAKSLKEFIEGDAGAHCEFFATALTLMLRSEGIPARFVAGYRSVEHDPVTRTLTIRDRHAHAWVEAFSVEKGWYTVDATPSADFGAGDGEGLFSAVGTAIGSLWESLTGFNGEGRSEALSWLTALPGRLTATVRDHWILSGLTVALLLGLLVARRRKPREDPTVREYRRAVRRAGLTSRAGETPRELLERARLMALPPKAMDRVRRATTAHEATRYAVR